MNIQKGNMYGFVTHTWNPIGGVCPHGCLYCYMLGFWKKELHLNEKILNEDLGKGNFIFVGSSTDMFAENVPTEWILKVLQRMNVFPQNHYLLQSKNPKGFSQFKELIVHTCGSINTLCTTIESDNDELVGRISKSPKISSRTKDMKKIDWAEKMITIEPILNFELEPFLEMIFSINPVQVNIGYDTKNHHLPEPKLEKTMELIDRLEKMGIKVFRKTLRKAWDE